MPRFASGASIRRHTSVLALGASVALAGLVGSAGAGPAAAVDLVPTTTTLQVSPSTVQEHQVLTLTGVVTVTPVPDPGPTPPAAGTVAFEDDFGGQTTSHPADTFDAGVATLAISSLAPGDHLLRAVFTSDGTAVASSTSADTQVTITPNTVDATGVGVSATLFYPVVDGYRDSILVKGVRDEPISVAIAIRNARGSTVRSTSITRDDGAYQWKWNGRNGAGKLVAAGTYMVSQTLRDQFGKTRVVKKSVTVSLKRLVWKTYSASRTLAQGTWISPAHYGKGWAFKVPGAVKYGKLTAKAYAWGNPVAIAVRSKSCSGSAWDLGCYPDYTLVYGTRLAWHSYSVAGATHVSATHVVRMVVVNVSSTSRAGCTQVRLTLRYAVLR